MLQQIVAAYDGDELEVGSPEEFYPVAPEIFEHWFRGGAGASIEHATTPDMRVVRRYASARVRDIVPGFDAGYARAPRAASCSAPSPCPSSARR